jgi:hypothetical protein
MPLLALWEELHRILCCATPNERQAGWGHGYAQIQDVDAKTVEGNHVGVKGLKESPRNWSAYVEAWNMWCCGEDGIGGGRNFEPTKATVRKRFAKKFASTSSAVCAGSDMPLPPRPGAVVT